MLKSGTISDPLSYPLLVVVKGKAIYSLTNGSCRGWYLSKPSHPCNYLALQNNFTSTTDTREHSHPHTHMHA